MGYIKKYIKLYIYFLSILLEFFIGENLYGLDFFFFIKMKIFCVVFIYVNI